MLFFPLVKNALQRVQTIEKEVKPMSESTLVGYARKSIGGGALKLSVDVSAFAEAEKYKTGDGREFVQLIANADKITEILAGEREVTSLCQIVDTPAPEPTPEPDN